MRAHTTQRAQVKVCEQNVLVVLTCALLDTPDLLAPVLALLDLLPRLLYCLCQTILHSTTGPCQLTLTAMAIAQRHSSILTANT